MIFPTLFFCQTTIIVRRTGQGLCRLLPQEVIRLCGHSSVACNWLGS